MRRAFGWGRNLVGQGAMGISPASQVSRAARGSQVSRAARGLILAMAGSVVLTGCVTDKVSDVTSSVGTVFATGEPRAPTRVPMFVVSTRKGKSGDANELSDGIRESLQTVTVPPGHRPGDIERPSFGGENPQHHFTVSAYRGLGGSEFEAELASHLSGRIGSNRDVLVYIHGFNTSYDDARYRLAQVAVDGRFGGVPVLFTWPASGSLFDYEAAKESASASRDALSQLFLELSNLPDVGRIQIVAHSMGCWLTMEALRQDAIAGKPDLNGKLGEVMLAAPDIDVSVFRQQIAKLDPSHISLLVSMNDRALSISRRLAGDRPRVGALNPKSAADKAIIDGLGVRVYDLSGEKTDFIGHGAYAAPDVVQQIGARIGQSRVQDADVTAVLGDRPVDNRIMTQPLPPEPTVNAPPLVPPATPAPAPAAPTPTK